jgi:hypothetical protein
LPVNLIASRLFFAVDLRNTVPHGGLVPELYIAPLFSCVGVATVDNENPFPGNVCLPQSVVERAGGTIQSVQKRVVLLAGIANVAVESKADTLAVPKRKKEEEKEKLW